MDLRKICLALLMLVGLGFSMEAKADPVQLTLTDTDYDVVNDSFTLTGFFTNSGTATFTANGWTLTFSPDLGPQGQSAVTTPPGGPNYARPVAGLSTSPTLPLLTVSLHAPPPSPARTYIGTLTFSGVDSNGLLIFTNSVQFRVNMPEVPVPEPATMFLLGTGVMAVGASIRRRRSAAKK
jgi:hypothetical protein